MADLGALLIERGAIDRSQLDSARSHQRSFGGRIEEILVEQRMVSEPKLADAIAQATGTRRVVLDEIQPEASARAKLPAAAAEEEVALPVALRDDGRTLWVAMTDPTDIPRLDRLAARAGCRIRPMVAGGREIRRAIALHYRGEVDAAVDMPSAPADSGEAFKVTDMSGKTLMTSLDVVRAQHEVAQQSMPKSSPYDDDEDPAADLFDIQAFSPDEVARIHKVFDHQEKGSLVLRALTELLLEKGLLRPEELRSKLGD
jgi:hypothetical protein